MACECAIDLVDNRFGLASVYRVTACFPALKVFGIRAKVIHELFAVHMQRRKKCGILLDKRSGTQITYNLSG